MLEQDDVMEKARQLRAAGVPLPEIEKYIASKRGQPAAPIADSEPGVGSKILGTIASTVRDIPGVEAAQAGIRSVVRGQSYRDALSDIHGAEDAAPKVATIPARIAGGTLAALTLPGGAIRQGASYGALSGALQSNPDAGVTERAGSALVDAALGGTVGAIGSGVNAIRTAPAGALRNAAGELMPRNIQRAAKTWRTLRAAASPTPKTLPNGLPEAVGDFVEPPAIGIKPLRATHVQQDLRPSIGLLEGSGFKNVTEAAKHQPTEPLIFRRAATAAEPPAPAAEGALSRAVKQKGRTNRQLNADADRLRSPYADGPPDLPLRPEAQGRPVEFARPGSVEDAAQEDLLMQQLLASLKRRP